MSMDWPTEIRRKAMGLLSAPFFNAAAEEVERLNGLISDTHKCTWTLDERHFMYDTSCGNAFQFSHGGLRDNNVTFCGYCGGKIAQTEGKP